jgi:hypothetical protein
MFHLSDHNRTIIISVLACCEYLFSMAAPAENVIIATHGSMVSRN